VEIEKRISFFEMTGHPVLSLLTEPFSHTAGQAKPIWGATQRFNQGGGKNVRQKEEKKQGGQKTLQKELSGLLLRAGP